MAFLFSHYKYQTNIVAFLGYRWPQFLDIQFFHLANFQFQRENYHPLY